MRELRLGDDAFVELAAEILLKGGSFQFRAHGASMAPFIRDGDLLTVAPVDAARLEIGDVALCRTCWDRIKAHRVVGKTVQDGVLLLETRGDARLSPDRPVPGDRVLGRVVRAQRGERVYRLDGGPWRLAACLWIGLFPLRRGLARPVRAAKGAALGMLQGLQSWGPYRRLARSVVGARARYRQADERDARTLARLFGQEMLPGLPEPLGWLAVRVAGKGAGVALMATVGRRPAGVIIAHRFPDDEPLYPGWWLFGPVVRARYRRAGIGGELLRLALEQAVAEGATWVHLLAHNGDVATRDLAKKAGFLPATLPALQTRLDDPPWPDERRRVILACALPGSMRNHRARMGL